MLDSALLQTNFVGRDGFIWWIGRVADPAVWKNSSTDNRKGWAYRCKVRIIGYHPFDESVMPEDDLPWAHVMVDPNSGAGMACVGSRHGGAHCRLTGYPALAHACCMLASLSLWELVLCRV